MPFGWEGNITFCGVCAMRSLNQIRCSLLYNVLLRLPFRKKGETRAICYFSNGKISLPGLYRAEDR